MNDSDWKLYYSQDNQPFWYDTLTNERWAVDADSTFTGSRANDDDRPTDHDSFRPNNDTIPSQGSSIEEQEVDEDAIIDDANDKSSTHSDFDDFIESDVGKKLFEVG
jgi:hypothetical protein